MPCSIIFADSIFRGLQHARKYIPRCNLSSRIYGDLGVLNVRRERHGSDLPLQFQRHIYQSVWSAEEGENLVCKREMSNPLDSYAVIVIKGEQTVGHLPRKISRLCALFLGRGGSITATVTRRRRRSVDLPQGGLEIETSRFACRIAGGGISAESGPAGSGRWLLTGLK